MKFAIKIASIINSIPGIFGGAGGDSPPGNKDFILLNDENFLLLNGEQFQLLGS